MGLALLHLGLLEAEKVRGLLPVKVQKALFQTGPQAVDVPGNEFHSGSLLPENRDVNDREHYNAAGDSLARTDCNSDIDWI